MNKKELRKLMRGIRESRREDAVPGQGEDAMPAELEALTRYLSRWHTLLLYWSMPDEVCTHSLVERLHREGHRVLLPRVVSDTEMTLHAYAGREQMRPGAFGILEPLTPAIDIASLRRGRDAAGVVPGMAFDAAGHRLGRGKGYYDRMLQQLPLIHKIGLCHDWQMVAQVPTDEHDVWMDKVVVVKNA
ncbi:MAG: 5-formyltetrahydrofolate cyclo-ligase [Prevotella sp.]|nr:5-formyltetrahydrofolate cyclo-ligase [Prevotella sp.]